MATRTYVEPFDDGPGGWAGRNVALEVADGAAISGSPWWVDANHAPPGAGYLHMLYVLWTTDSIPKVYQEAGGRNRFVEGGFPTDFTNARMTLRLKGELDAKGAQLLLLVQARIEEMSVAHVLTEQPFEVTRDWSEQTAALVPDPDQWLCVGARHDLGHEYGYADIAGVLRDVNVDVILVLHPLDVVPVGPIARDPNILWAGRDYEPDYSRLPEGHVLLDEVRIEFPVA